MKLNVVIQRTCYTSYLLRYSRVLVKSSHLVALLPGWSAGGADKLLSIALLYCIILLYYDIALLCQGQAATK